MRWILLVADNNGFSHDDEPAEQEDKVASISKGLDAFDCQATSIELQCGNLDRKRQSNIKQIEARVRRRFLAAID